MQIEDGTGNSQWLKVNGNKQAHVFAVTESEINAANSLGNQYNLNTGPISLTGTGESAMFYLKNTESAVNGETSFIITGLALWTGPRTGTITDDPLWTVIRMPTGGDIISSAVNVDVNSNSNFTSPNVLSSPVYRGKDGGTITGGTDHIYIAGTGRVFAPLDIQLVAGASFGIKVDINTDGGCNAYAAVIGYRKDGNI